MSSSTALQKLPSTRTRDGSLQVRPLRLIPTDSNVEEPVAIPSSATVSISAVGQSQRLTLREHFTVGAPLPLLYHKIIYRGLYSMDQLPIHQTVVIGIPLKIHHQALVTSTSSSSTSTNTNTNTNPTQQPTQQQHSLLSLQLECTLRGPPRSEILAAHQALGSWLTLVDKIEDIVKETWNKMEPQIPQAAKKKEAILLVIPAMAGILVPVTTVCVVLSPLVIGVCTLFFPIMIPLVVGMVLFVLAVILGTASGLTTLYFSTRHGRKQLDTWWNQQSTLQHYWNVAKGPRFGFQTFFYATGPRPTPVSIVRTQLPKDKWRRLGVSLSIDSVGSFSYLLPFVGEAFDVVWAPAQTVLIMALYQHVSPNMSYVSFAEELLPFLDVLPSATTGWMMEFGPELWEEAKLLLDHPKETLQSLQLVLWGNDNSRAGPTTSSRPLAAHRRPVPPPERPSRHA
jgi:hypothetical protein